MRDALLLKYLINNNLSLCSWCIIIFFCVLTLLYQFLFYSYLKWCSFLVTQKYRHENVVYCKKYSMPNPFYFVQSVQFYLIVPKKLEIMSLINLLRTFVFENNILKRTINSANNQFACRKFYWMNFCRKLMIYSNCGKNIRGSFHLDRAPWDITL